MTDFLPSFDSKLTDPPSTEAPFNAAPTMMPSDINATTYSTFAPTTSPTEYEPVETNLSYLNDNIVWMVLWFCTMIVFLGFPFTSKKRRKFCMRGIRERRWINDEEWDEESQSHSQRERRQQQREENQRRFQTTRTQEDDIRQQYLSYLLERYTVELKESDIHEGEEGKCADDTESSDEEKEQIKTDEDKQCDTTLTSTDRGSHDTIDTDEANNAAADIEAPTPVRENRADSEDSDNLLATEFDNDQMVSVPFSGQTASAGTRQVSNGCAICLCAFEAGEKITYSSNPDCCHVFHNDCIINWYNAVGRKTQRRRKKNNPNMTDEEALGLICDFPINCPCCRQPFCPDTNLSCEQKEEAEDESESLESAEVWIVHRR